MTAQEMAENWLKDENDSTWLFDVLDREHAEHEIEAGKVIRSLLSAHSVMLEALERIMGERCDEYVCDVIDAHRHHADALEFIAREAVEQVRDAEKVRGGDE